MDKRDLGVDDYVPVFRKVDDDIGFLQAVIVGTKASLGIVLKTVTQAGPLQYLVENKLSPVTLGLGVAF